MDQLAAITLFCKVVEVGSFSGAAQQLNLSPSSVSRRITDLENWIGAALFQRTTRQINLTDVGQQYYERTRPLLLDLEEARIVAAKLENKPSGQIQMSIPASLEPHLISAIGAFRNQWPEVSFALTFTDRLVDLVSEGFDLALRIGQLEDSTLRARKITEVRRRLCASPRYLAKRGEPGNPSDLAAHDCNIFRSRPGYNVWRFKEGKSLVDVRASGGLCANSGVALVTAARQDMGLVLAPEWLVGPDLANNTLVEVLSGVQPEPAHTPLYAVHPYQRFVPPKVKVFVDFLVARFALDYNWGELPFDI